ncbi:MAG: ROK family protein [Pseudothermotoga sp.]
MFFVCDIGGTNLRVAVTSEDGIIMKKNKFSTPRDYDQLLCVLKKEFKEASREFSISSSCISVAGAVFKNNTVWLPNVFGPKRFSLAGDLENSFTNSEIHVIDDRVAGLLGELYRGCAVGKKDVLYLIVGTGVGLGILSNGLLVSGSQSLAGSVGWIRITDPLTGGVETVEDVLSGPSILKRFRMVCNYEVRSTEEIFHLYNQDTNDCTKKLVHTTAQVLGYLLSILTNIFNPELIILAGSLSTQWNVFKDVALEVLRQNTSPSIQQPRFEISTLGEDAQLIGCAKYLLTLRRKE